MHKVLDFLLLNQGFESTKINKDMQKRQIFREQVLPHSGGKIPEEAFRSDRLALNRLNAQGIAVPDGILLESRRRESHFPSHRNDPEIDKSIIKLIQTPDGRYAPPEGRYPFNNVIESTYIIRRPINALSILIPPQQPVKTTLRLPAKPFFQPDQDIFSIGEADNSFDLLNTYNTDFPGSKLWSGFGPFFHDSTNRILRQTRKDTVPDNGPTSPENVYPSLNTIPQTPFKCLISQNVTHHAMVPDPNTSCQVFHLCHQNGNKESFLCPQGLRFDPGKNQCSPWKEVPCPPV
uniref:Putative chitin binding peritrophin-a domain protein n=1 Tax=Rhodnius prolixus TaxID=13249 RepID=R4G5Q1_RHOPR